MLAILERGSVAPSEIGSPQRLQLGTPRRAARPTASEIRDGPERSAFTLSQSAAIEASTGISTGLFALVAHTVPPLADARRTSQAFADGTARETDLRGAVPRRSATD